MRDSVIDQIKLDAESLEPRFDAFIKKITTISNPEGGSFDLSQQINETDSSISDIRARVAVMSGLVRKFDSKGGELVPFAHLNAMVRSNRAIRNAFDLIESSLTNFLETNGGVQAIDHASMALTAPNGQTMEIMSPLKVLYDGVETYLQNFQNVFQATNPSRAAFNFSAATKALSSIISRANVSRDNLEKSLNKASRDLAAISAAGDELNRTAVTAREQLNTINDHVARGGEAVAQIAARNDEASALNAATQDLKGAVERYRADFDSFQSEIDARRSAIESGNSDLSSLIEKFRAQEKDFDGLIEKSSQMLSGSTVAGLASEFGSIRKDLSNELNLAHESFNWSVVILAVSALPLILFIFAPFIAPYMSQDDRLVSAIAGVSAEKGGWQYVGQVIARLVIILPAIWYVTFCSVRYNSLFKLREHYSFKYSMAVAVEGFKKQSPGHEDMIAALVFEQLSFNPADKLGKPPTGPQTPPNPIAALFLKALRRDVGDDAP